MPDHLDHRDHLEHRDRLTHLDAEVARFQDAIGDLDAPVPACPDWRVRDLVRHLGSVHRMFRRVADEGLMHRPPRLDPDDRPEADDDRIVAWAEEQAARLLTALRHLDPDAPRWNFTTGPQVGAFIPRRMLHETTIHRWDLENAYGTPGSIGEDVARDGVREYLEVLRLRWDPWEGEPAVVRTDLGGGDTIDLRLEPGAEPQVRSIDAGSEDGAPVDDVATEPDVILQADPVTLYLAWWGRRSLTASLIAGEAAVVGRVRAVART